MFQKCFTHAEDSPFKPAIYGEKHVVVSANPNDNIASGGNRRYIKAKNTDTVQWGQEYQKMVDEIRNLDVKELQVVEVKIPLSQISPSHNQGEQQRQLSQKQKNHKQDQGQNSSHTANLQTYSIQLDTVDKALPEGWKERISTTTGRTYYGNIYDGTSTWTRPTEPARRSRGDQQRNKPTLSEQAEKQSDQRDQAPNNQDEVAYIDVQDEGAHIEPEKEVYTSHSSQPSIQPPADRRPQLNSTISSARPESCDIAVRVVPMLSPTDLPTVDPENSSPVTLPRYALSKKSLPNSIARRATILHCVITGIMLIISSVLWGLQRQWIKDKRFSDDERCTSGPPLMEWAFGMSLGLLIFAILVFANVVWTRSFSNSVLRGALLTVALANFVVFILGHEWAFHKFPRADSPGCSTSWTLPHIEYIWSVVVIACSYVGYGLGIGLYTAGRCTRTVDASWKNVQAEPRQSIARPLIINLPDTTGEPEVF